MTANVGSTDGATRSLAGRLELGVGAGAPRPAAVYGRCEPYSNRADVIVEQTVLTEALLRHPVEQLTILELAIRMETDWEHLAGTDIVERAVRELSRCGLLDCDCRRIWPTRAALRFDALLGGGV